MTEQPLPGIRTEPLASYLAGLGLLRVVGEQVDPAATARWHHGTLVIDTAVADLASWLVDEYVPTPVISPWNGGSGFGEKDKAPRATLDALIALPGSRVEAFRRSADVAHEVMRRARADRWEKGAIIRELRNRGPEELLPWLDASVVLANDQVYFPPLLGTGGNDGRLEFSHTFHKRLTEVLDPAAAARRKALTHAHDLLAGTQEAPLRKAMMGQFDPAGAGGKRSSPFGDADSLGNPWAYILLIEGAVLFAASAARRHMHAAGRMAMPFTVAASPDGTASGADDESSRGEVWAPVWDRPFTYGEVRQLFTEARASWRGRPAQRAVEFYAATRTLGVARGVGAFTRYGIHQRNGLAFVAVPTDRVQVCNAPEVRLLAQLEDWVSWVRRGESTTAVGQATRRFDKAHMEFARDGGPRKLAELLARLTDLEMAAGRSGRVRSTVPVRRPPAADEFLTELDEASSPELRVAVGLASCAVTLGNAPGGATSRTMRQLLLPVDPQEQWRATALVAGFGVRPLMHVLADVLAWRARTAPDEPDATSFRGTLTRFRGVPTFRRGVPVPAADLHALAAGRLRDDLLDLYFRACLALRWDGVQPRWRSGSRDFVPVPTLTLLHALAAGLAPSNAEPGTARLALNPDWPVRLAAGQINAVHGEAVRKLRQAGWLAVPPLRHVVADGHAVAAALVPRCRDSQSVLVRYGAVPLRQEPGAAEPENTAELVEETS